VVDCLDVFGSQGLLDRGSGTWMSIQAFSTGKLSGTSQSLLYVSSSETGFAAPLHLVPGYNYYKPTRPLKISTVMKRFKFYIDFTLYFLKISADVIWEKKCEKLKEKTKRNVQKKKER
jgi:hypothetical protein